MKIHRSTSYKNCRPLFYWDGTVCWKITEREFWRSRHLWTAWTNKKCLVGVGLNKSVRNWREGYITSICFENSWEKSRFFRYKDFDPIEDISEL